MKIKINEGIPYTLHKIDVEKRKLEKLTPIKSRVIVILHFYEEIETVDSFTKLGSLYQKAFSLKKENLNLIEDAIKNMFESNIINSEKDYDLNKILELRIRDVKIHKEIVKGIDKRTYVGFNSKPLKKKMFLARRIISDIKTDEHFFMEKNTLEKYDEDSDFFQERYLENSNSKYISNTVIEGAEKYFGTNQDTKISNIEIEHFDNIFELKKELEFELTNSKEVIPTNKITKNVIDNINIEKKLFSSIADKLHSILEKKSIHLKLGEGEFNIELLSKKTKDIEISDAVIEYFKKPFKVDFFGSQKETLLPVFTKTSRKEYAKNNNDSKQWLTDLLPEFRGLLLDQEISFDDYSEEELTKLIKPEKKFLEKDYGVPFETLIKIYELKYNRNSKGFMPWSEQEQEHIKKIIEIEIKKDKEKEEKKLKAELNKKKKRNLKKENNMSHIVQVITNAEAEEINKKCNDSIKRMNEDSENVSSMHGEFKNIINEKISNANKIKEKIIELSKIRQNSGNRGSQAMMDKAKLQSNLNTLMKEVSNIKSGYDFSKKVSKSLKGLEDVFSKFGTMANVAAKMIFDKNETINKDLLLEQIDIIRNQEIESNQLLEEKNNVEEYIISLEIPNSIKDNLIDKVNNLTTPQEVNDSRSFAATQEIEFKAVKERFLKFKLEIEKKNFIYKSSEVFIDSNNEVVTSARFVKENSTEEFVLNFVSDKFIKWQMGNYTNHICQKDSEDIEEVVNKNFTVSRIEIKRDISNDIPLQSAKIELKGEM